MGTLLHSCVKVHRAIELSCGVVSWVGPGIHVLDGSPRASRGRGCFWHGFWHLAKIRSIDFDRWHDTEKCIRLMCEKLTVFSYARYTIEFCVKFPYDIVRFKIEVGIEEKFICKNVSKQTRHAHFDNDATRRPCFSIDLDRAVNMLRLCDTSNLLLVLSAEERHTFLKLLWGLVLLGRSMLQQLLLYSLKSYWTVVLKCRICYLILCVLIAIIVVYFAVLGWKGWESFSWSRCHISPKGDKLHASCVSYKSRVNYNAIFGGCTCTVTHKLDWHVGVMMWAFDWVFLQMQCFAGYVSLHYLLPVKCDASVTDRLRHMRTF